MDKVLHPFDLLLGMAFMYPRLEAITHSVEELESMNIADNKSIGSVLEENAVVHADRPAFYFEDIVLSYKEFNELVNRYAHYFIEQGLQKGDVVIVYLENRLSTVIMISALSKIGAVSSLINANQTGEVLLHSIQTDQGKYFAIGEERIDDFEAIKDELVFNGDELFFGIVDDSHPKISFPKGYSILVDEIKSHAIHNPTSTASVTLGDRFANVFTSGTTGMPKASIQNHRKWHRCYHWYGVVNMGLHDKDVLYVPIPFFHTNALVVAWPSAAVAGAAIVIRRKLSISNFWSDVKKYGVTSFIYIGEVCRYLLNREPSPDDTNHTVRMVVGNGLRPEIWKTFKRRFNIPRIVELYGASDGNVTFVNVFNIDCTVGFSANDYVIVKYDVDNEEPIYNGEGFMELVKPGEAGLCLGRISDDMPFAGYVNAKRNVNKIMENVFEAGDKFFYTGDILHDLGYKHARFVDRIGDTFRWKGENVSTQQIETLLNRHPNVLHSGVFGISLPHIDGKAGFAAIMTETAEEHFDFKQFYTDIKKDIPSYAIPIFIRLVSHLNRTATHKIQKSQLKKDGLSPTNGDVVYVSLPASDCYVKMNDEILEMIDKGEVKF